LKGKKKNYFFVLLLIATPERQCDGVTAERQCDGVTPERQCDGVTAAVSATAWPKLADFLLSEKCRQNFF
jgi:hypothetical protein